MLLRYWVTCIRPLAGLTERVTSSLWGAVGQKLRCLQMWDEKTPLGFCVVLS